jgi:hypothetical protein
MLSDLPRVWLLSSKDLPAKEAKNGAEARRREARTKATKVTEYCQIDVAGDAQATKTQNVIRPCNAGRAGAHPYLPRSAEEFFSSSFFASFRVFRGQIPP